MDKKNELQNENLQAIDKLLNTPEQKMLTQWYDEELIRELGGSADDLVGTLGDLRKAFLTWSEQANLSEILCKRFDYHAMKEKYATPLHLTVAISELLAGIQGYHAPLTIAVIIVQWAGDKLCDGH